MELLRRPKNLVKAIRSWWLQPLESLQTGTLQATQVALASQYREMWASGRPLPALTDVGFKVYSDGDEDGILLYLFALVGSGGRRLIDIGAASYSSSNTANLLLHHRWTGLLIEGNPDAVASARAFYDAASFGGVQVVNSFVTSENVNDILREHGVTGEVDLLSIDIDGMDYWVWRSTSVISPRVVVIEFQDILGRERAVTVPYSPSFRLRNYPVNAHSNDYVGASLSAMIKLGREKGYRLVGTNRLGYNAIFVRNDLGTDIFDEVDASDCLNHPWNEYGMRERYPRVAHMPWVEV